MEVLLFIIIFACILNNKKGAGPVFFFDCIKYSTNTYYTFVVNLRDKYKNKIESHFLTVYNFIIYSEISKTVEVLITYSVHYSILNNNQNSLKVDIIKTCN